MVTVVTKTSGTRKEWVYLISSPSSCTCSVYLKLYHVGSYEKSIFCLNNPDEDMTVI